MNTPTLSEHVDEYLRLRTSLGSGVKNHKTLLHSFVGFVEQRGEAEELTTQTALSWALSSPTSGPSGQAQRMTIVRGFLSYLQAFNPNVQVPDRGLLKPVRRKPPYLFSDEEIERMVAAASALKPRDSTRSATYGTLIGLLASTGIRICEALNLKAQDVRLAETPACLIVRNAKFGKSRLVPLHPTAAEGLRKYQPQRANLGASDHFFVSTRGLPLRYRAVWNTFQTIWERSGVRANADGRAPTIHCLRHTFAVKRLLAWQQGGVDIRAMLPHLSVYLGHTEPRNTYWYLSATPELLAAAARQFAFYAKLGDEP